MKKKNNKISKKNQKSQKHHIIPRNKTHKTHETTHNIPTGTHIKTLTTPAKARNSAVQRLEQRQTTKRPLQQKTNA